MKRRQLIDSMGALLAVLVLSSVVLVACDDEESMPEPESTSEKLKSDDAEKREEGVSDAEKKYQGK